MATFTCDNFDFDTRDQTENILLGVLESICAAKVEIAYPSTDGEDFSHWNVEAKNENFIAYGNFNGFRGKTIQLSKKSTVWTEYESGIKRRAVCMGDYHYDSSDVRALIDSINAITDGSNAKRNMNKLDSLWLSVKRHEKQKEYEENSYTISDNWW